MLARLETRQEQLLAEVAKFQQENVRDRIAKEQLLNGIAEIDRRIAERDKLLVALDGGIQINAQTIEWAKETETKSADAVSE